MDTPIPPMERSHLFPGSGRVKPAHESAREKERKKFSEELEEELEEELNRKKQDTVELVGDSEQGESPAERPARKPDTVDPGDAPEHIDLTA